jgi:hypothetical protein
MHFPTLMVERDPPAALSAEVSDLMARKTGTRELGTAPLPATVAAFIDREFELTRACFESGRAHASEEVMRQSVAFCRMVVRLDREDRQPGYLEFILLRRNTLRYSAWLGSTLVTFAAGALLTCCYAACAWHLTRRLQSSDERLSLRESLTTRAPGA